MTSERCIFAPDRQGQRSVHLERFDRRASGRSQPQEDYALPLKVIRPRILTWAEEWNFFAGLRIGCRSAGSFPQRAGYAGERKILEVRLAPVLARDYVVDVEGRFLTRLG